jgi:hypothetical protein
MRGVRMQPVRTVPRTVPKEAKIDAWIEGQLDPKPFRSEAIRCVVEKGLQAVR